MKTFKQLRENTESTTSEMPEDSSWYNVHTKQFVPVSDSHSLEVIRRPHMFGVTQSELKDLVKQKNEDSDPEGEFKSFLKYKHDWHPEVAHIMHDRGWLRIRNSHDEFYVGGNNKDHVTSTMKELTTKHLDRIQSVKNNKNPYVTTHVYDYIKNYSGFPYDGFQEFTLSDAQKYGRKSRD